MSRFTFDVFHDYRQSAEHQDSIKLQKGIPFTGEPGHRYANGSPLPGASLKGRYDSPKSDYRPSVKVHQKPLRAIRSNSTGRSTLPTLKRSVSPRPDLLPRDRSASLNDNGSALSRRTWSAPRSSASPYARVVSLSPKSISKRPRDSMTPFDPEDTYPQDSLSSSVSLPGYTSSRFNSAIPTSLPKQPTTPQKFSSSVSIDRGYRGESSSYGRREFEGLSTSSSSVYGLSSLESSTKINKRFTSPHQSKPLDFTQIIADVDATRSEKINILANQFRETLIEDARMFDGAQVNTIFFPTRCPRSSILQDARNRAIQMVSMWKHASLMTIGDLDLVQETYALNQQEQQRLAGILAQKRATIDLMLQQRRSLSNYLSFLRENAANRGLGNLVFESNPQLSSHIESFVNQNKNLPVDDQIFNLRNKTLDESEKSKGNIINLHDINSGAEEEIFDKIPVYAKKILSTTWKNPGSIDSSIQSESRSSSRQSSRNTSPSGSRSNSITGGILSTLSPRLMPRPPKQKPTFSANQESSTYDQDFNHQNYNEDEEQFYHQKQPTPSSITPSRLSTSRGHSITPIQPNFGDNIQSGDAGGLEGSREHEVLDDWGMQMSKLTPTSAARELAKSMALKNIKIRAMIAKSPDKRIIGKDTDFDSLPITEEETHNDYELYDNYKADDYNTFTGTENYEDYVASPQNSNVQSVTHKHTNGSIASPMSSNGYMSENDHRLSSISLHDLVNLDVNSPKLSSKTPIQDNYISNRQRQESPNPMHSRDVRSRMPNGGIANQPSPRLSTQNGTHVQSLTPQELSISPKVNVYSNPNPSSGKSQKPIGASQFLRSIVSAITPEDDQSSKHSMPNRISPNRSSNYENEFF